MNNENSEHNWVLLHHSIFLESFCKQTNFRMSTLCTIKTVSTMEFRYITALFGIFLETNTFLNVYIMNNQSSEHYWVCYITAMFGILFVTIKILSTIKFCCITALFGIFWSQPNFQISTLGKMKSFENSEHNRVLLLHIIAWYLFRDKQISECLHHEWSKQWALLSFFTSLHCLASFSRQANFQMST